MVRYETDDAAAYDEAEGDDRRGAKMSRAKDGVCRGLHGGQGGLDVGQLELDPLLQVYPRRAIISSA